MSSVAEIEMQMLFQAIGMCGDLLGQHDPAKVAAAWEREANAAYFLNPTLMLKVHAQQADMDRKLRLIKAAAAFVREVEAVHAEAVAALPETARDVDVAKNYG